jgi:hypothetical protein
MATAIDIVPENKQAINKLLSSDEPLTLVGGERSEERVLVPESVKPLLKQILAEMAKGNEVAVLARDAEMTTQVKVKDVLFYEQSLKERKRGRAVDPPIKMRDMSKDMRWLAEHRDEYAGKWVAVYEDRLVQRR